MRISLRLLVAVLSTVPFLLGSPCQAGTPDKNAAKKGKTRLELANQVFKLTGTEAELKKTAGELIKIQVKSSKVAELARFLKKDKYSTDSFTKAMAEVLEKDLDLVGELHATFAAEYAKSFNEKELKTMIDYYQSPAGKKGMKIGPQFEKDIVNMKRSRLEPMVDKTYREALSQAGIAVGKAGGKAK